MSLNINNGQGQPPSRNKSNGQYISGGASAINQSANNQNSLFKVLKKSQIDTTTGNGFMFSNTMTASQLRTHSRNNNQSGQQPLSTTATGGPLAHFLDSGNILGGLDLTSSGSPNITNKKQQSSAPSRNSYAGNAMKKQQYYTQTTQQQSNKFNELSPLVGGGSANNSNSGKNNTTQRQNSNRRLQQQQQQQQLQQQNMVGASASLQVQNLTQFLKDQSKSNANNNILPPMAVTSSNQNNQKTPYSRNVAYKQSLSDSITSKMIKGLSPKNNAIIESNYLQQSNSPHKNNRANSQINQDTNLADTGNMNFSLKANKTSNMARTRNAAQSLGRTGDLAGISKPQFYTMKNGATSNLQQQSPHNYSSRFNSNSAIFKSLLPNANGNNSSNTTQTHGQSSSQQAAPSHSINGFGLEYDPTLQFIQTYDPAKFASKRNGVVVSYAANTHQGIIRNYNEDRVSIILNIIQPKFKEADLNNTSNSNGASGNGKQPWPRCSFFGVYDGHGGAACADYLRDQLHQMIVKDNNFPMNPKKAMENAFDEAEKTFLEFADSQAIIETGQIDRSGSCAIIVLIVGDMCYVGNVGDSRAIMSVDGGEKILLLSKDHKPESDDETQRIEENGGRIYQNSNYIPDLSANGKGQMQLIVGPHRVFPGRLSVSRTFGDIEAKEVKYGGNPKVVIPTPDIRSFKIRNNYDFIIIACDGVFEKLSNQEVVNAVWQASRVNPKQNQGIDNRSIHEKCGHSIDRILHTSAFKRTFDNITAVMIAFENFENIAGQAIANSGDQDSQQRMPSMNVQEFDKFNVVQQTSLETVVEEEYIQNEEIDPSNLLQPLSDDHGHPLSTFSDPNSTQNQPHYKPIYQQQSNNMNDQQSSHNNATTNNTQEDYQFDIQATSLSLKKDNNHKQQLGISSRKKSAENLILQAQGKDTNNTSNTVQRRQSASSPINQRKKLSSQGVVSNYSGNSQSALNYQSNNNNNSNGNNGTIPMRQSFQIQNQQQQQNHQLQTRMSDSSFSQTKQQSQNAGQDLSLQQKNNNNNLVGVRNNKSSSLGRRENRGSAGLYTNGGNSGGSNGMAMSASSRNENRKVNQMMVNQQLTLTQSLVQGLAPFTNNYQIESNQTSNGKSTNTKNPTRNSQLKQYSSLGNGTHLTQNSNTIPLIAHNNPIKSTNNNPLNHPTQIDLDFNKTQQLGTSSQQKINNNNNSSGKNWFSNTQQLSGISQLHKHYEKEKKNNTSGKAKLQ